ncbi:MAG: lamin tail domain-containing protein [Haloarculaceae archaeon]
MRSPGVRIVFLVSLVVLAGCSAGDLPGDPGTQTHTVGEGRVATVASVVDGDTVDVRFPDGSTDTVRLLGVDVPEIRADNEPGEYEGVPDTPAGRECLRAAGLAASNDVADLIEGRTVTVATDPVADRRGSYDRLLAYVILEERTTGDGRTTADDGTSTGTDAVALEGEPLNEWLVATGRARVYDAEFATSAAFYDAETTAQREGLGLWQCRDGSPTTVTAMTSGQGGLVLGTVHEDAAGPDEATLTDEYLVFVNAGDEALQLGGWGVVDAAGKAYTIPEGVELAPADRLRLVTGAGVDGNGTLYWNAPGPIWNNDGDVVSVRAENGTLVLREDY